MVLGLAWMDNGLNDGGMADSGETQPELTELTQTVAQAALPHAPCHAVS